MFWVLPKHQTKAKETEVTFIVLASHFSAEGGEMA